MEVKLNNVVINMVVLLKLRAHAHGEWEHYFQIKKTSFYEKKFIVAIDQFIFISRCAHQRRQAHSDEQGLHYQPEPQGQQLQVTRQCTTRRTRSAQGSGGPLEARLNQALTGHFIPIVGTVCTPIDLVDIATEGQAVSGVQPVGEC